MENTLIIIVGGQAAIVVGHIVFDWLKNSRNQKNKGEPHCSLNRAGTIHKIDDLHLMHSRTNNDGTPIWYFPQSIEPNIAKMVEHLRNIEKGINGK